MRQSGAFSGILDLKAGDRIEWECEVVNDSMVTLRLPTYAVHTGRDVQHVRILRAEHGACLVGQQSLEAPRMKTKFARLTRRKKTDPELSLNPPLWMGALFERRVFSFPNAVRKKTAEDAVLQRPTTMRAGSV